MLSPTAAGAAVPPRLLQLLEVLKGSLGDVKSWMDLPQTGLSDQGQATQPQVGMERVWRTGSGRERGRGEGMGSIVRDGRKKGETRSEMVTCITAEAPACDRSAKSQKKYHYTYYITESIKPHFSFFFFFKRHYAKAIFLLL